MLFLICFGAFGFLVSATGFLMFAFPLKYVAIINWYLKKAGFGGSASSQKYSRWYYRLSGFALFSASFLIWYALFLQVKTQLH